MIHKRRCLEILVECLGWIEEGWGDKEVEEIGWEETKLRVRDNEGSGEEEGVGEVESVF